MTIDIDPDIIFFIIIILTIFIGFSYKFSAEDILHDVVSHVQQ